ncbi:MAG: RNA-binding protein [Bacteroides sp.]|nr:RNA-binding protein [Bacteroides sp.]
MSMYFGNLNYRIKERDLERMLANYGNIISVKIVKDHNTGKSKGFGFVEMENPMSEYRIIHSLNGSELMGRQMIVREARMR